MWRAILPLGASVSVLRHGESENNRLGIECTSLVNRDLYGLTATGIEQVEAAAKEWREFDAILHSPLRRAVETARILADRWGAAIASEELLIELDVGVFENRTEAEYVEWKRRNDSHFHPSGESEADIAGRARALLKKLNADHHGERILLVTHGTFLFHLLGAVFDDIDWPGYNRAFRHGRRIFELRTYEALPG